MVLRPATPQSCQGTSGQHNASNKAALPPVVPLMSSSIGRLGLAAVVVVLLAASPPPSPRAARPATTCPVRPANNIWITDVSTIPVHSQPAAWLSSTGATGGTLLHPDFGGPPYGIPFHVVTSSHPTANFTFQYWRESAPTVPQ